MLVDGLLVLIAVGAVVSGYRRGFLQALFATVGYIGGGVLGLALALHFVGDMKSDMNRIGAIILAIFVAAELGRRVLGLTAKFFRTRILWAPLRFVDSIAGVVLEFVRVTLIAYLVISVLLWSPWTAVRSALRESTIYPKITQHLPNAVKEFRSEIEKKLAITLP